MKNLNMSCSDEDMSSNEDMEDSSDEAENQKKINKTEKKTKKRKLDNGSAQLSDLEAKFDHSKLFTVQIEDFLNEQRLRASTKNDVLKLYDEVQNFLLHKINDAYSAVPISELKSSKGFLKYLSKCDIPLTTNEDLVLQFKRPTSCFKLQTFNFEVKNNDHFIFKAIVEMPKELFRKRDFINNIYFIRKYYYCYYLGNSIQQAKLCKKFELYNCNGILYLPVLRLFTNIDNVVFDIYTCPEENTFKLSRFIPSTNNLKLEKGNDELQGGTAFYNSSLLHDLTLNVNNKFYEECFKGSKHFVNVFCILRFWLHNCHLLTPLGGFSEDLLIYTLCHIFYKTDTMKYQNSYQLIKLVLQTIVSSEWENEVLKFEDAQFCEIKAYKEKYDFVWLDKTGCFNVATFLNKDVYYKLKSNAATAIKTIQNGLF